MLDNALHLALPGPAPLKRKPLEDTVEFFNHVLQVKLNEQEKKDLVAFLRAL